jgi:hypothetical protein
MESLRSLSLSPALSLSKGKGEGLKNTLYALFPTLTTLSLNFTLFGRGFPLENPFF